MSDPHRDELAAAHARIAALEEKIEQLTHETDVDPHDEKIAELESRLRRVKAMGERNVRWMPALMASPVAFALIVPALSFLLALSHPPYVAIAVMMAVAVFLFAALFRLTKWWMTKVTAQGVAKVEGEIADAKRIAKLERRVAAIATGDARMRVGTAEEREAEEEAVDAAEEEHAKKA